MATSKPFTLGSDSFILENSTVIRTPTKPIPSPEVSAAGSAGYLNSDGSINYVNVFGKGNYEVLGATNSFMQSLATNPTYWNTINKAFGGTTVNAAFSPSTGQLSSSINEVNKDANQFSTVGNFTNLRYPIKNDGNFDFLKITCLEYTSNTFAEKSNDTSLEEANTRIPKAISERKKKIIGSVALPMQPGISESNSVGWGEDRLNAIQIMGARLADRAMKDLSNMDPVTAANNFMSGLDSSMRKVLEDSGLGENVIATYFAGQAVGANIFTRGTGQVLNPNLELLFSGPNLRTFNYTYRFTPRDSQEASEVKSIIRFFKKNMAPKRTTTGLFLQTPNVFKLKYIFANGDQHPFLNNIKICALTGFTVDYTPDGSYMTYGDGSMTSYQISMQFNELDPIYHDDFDNGEGTQGTGY